LASRGNRNLLLDRVKVETRIGPSCHEHRNRRFVGQQTRSTPIESDVTSGQDGRLLIDTGTVT